MYNRTSDSVVGDRKVLFNDFVKPRMFAQSIAPTETGSHLFSLVYLIIFLAKLSELGCLS